jgi:hypothetical protein
MDLIPRVLCCRIGVPSPPFIAQHNMKFAYSRLCAVLLFASALAIMLADSPNQNVHAASPPCVNLSGANGCDLDLQSAINKAQPGDIISIASGVYTISNPTPIGQSPEIDITTSNLTLQGAGLSTIVTPTLRNVATNTVISNLMSRDAPFYGIRNEGDLALVNVAVVGASNWGVYNIGGNLRGSNIAIYSSPGLVCNLHATASFTNAVISTMSAYRPFYCDRVILTNVTFTEKISPASPLITATNTIFNQGCTSTISSLGHNIDREDSCGLNATADLTATNPMLTPPLTVNGMLASTLYASSPAIDHGDDSICPSNDVTGLARFYGTHCDIGAYEWRPMYISFFSLLLNNK